MQEVFARAGRFLRFPAGGSSGNARYKAFLPLAPDKRGQRQFGNLLEKKNRLGRTLIQYFA